MERRSFIKLSGLTTFGLLASGHILASNFKRKNYQIIEINPPNIHVRHGFFNLQAANKNKLHIQRDLFNKNGSETVSENRMASIKIVSNNTETFGIIDKDEFKSVSKDLIATKLKANQLTSINIGSESLIFSEHEELTLDNKLLQSNQAFYQLSKGKIDILSKVDQSAFIYRQS